METTKKPVGILLGFCIFAMPWFFAWFTLQKGRSLTSRVIAFSWLIFVFVSVATAPERPQQPPSEPLPVVVEKSVPAKEPEKPVEIEYPKRETSEEIVNNAMFQAGLNCFLYINESIEREPKLGFQWGNKLNNDPGIDSYTWIDMDYGIIAVFGSGAEIRNKSGAFEPVRYRCDFDVFDKNILKVYIPAKPVLKNEVTRSKIDNTPEKYIIERADELNDKCRGGSGNDKSTINACEDREVVMRQLQSIGICWGNGSRDQIEADKTWQQCDKAKPPVSLMGKAIKYKEIKVEKQ